jgi:hypothetical protein
MVPAFFLLVGLAGRPAFGAGGGPGHAPDAGWVAVDLGRGGAAAPAPGLARLPVRPGQGAVGAVDRPVALPGLEGHEVVAVVPAWDDAGAAVLVALTHIAVEGYGFVEASAWDAQAMAAGRAKRRWASDGNDPTCREVEAVVPGADGLRLVCGFDAIAGEDGGPRAAAIALPAGWRVAAPWGGVPMATDAPPIAAGVRWRGRGRTWDVDVDVHPWVSLRRGEATAAVEPGADAVVVSLGVHDHPWTAPRIPLRSSVAPALAALTAHDGGAGASGAWRADISALEDALGRGDDAAATAARGRLRARLDALRPAARAWLHAELAGLGDDPGILALDAATVAALVEAAGHAAAAERARLAWLAARHGAPAARRRLLGVGLDPALQGVDAQALRWDLAAEALLEGWEVDGVAALRLLLVDPAVDADLAADLAAQWLDRVPLAALGALEPGVAARVDAARQARVGRYAARPARPAPPEPGAVTSDARLRAVVQARSKALAAVLAVARGRWAWGPRLVVRVTAIDPDGAGARFTVTGTELAPALERALTWEAPGGPATHPAVGLRPGEVAHVDVVFTE